jgi:copper chaperone CopZ
MTGEKNHIKDAFIMHLMLKYFYRHAPSCYIRIERKNMKSETLRLLGDLDKTRAMEVGRVLDAVNGVSKVVITTASESVQVDFDENITSIQEVRAALQQAGFGIARLAHKEPGMCCGSCGG